MARLVCVFGEQEAYKLARRQLPLSVDDNKVMVMQLNDTCEYCDVEGLPNKQQFDDCFVHQYNSLTKDELIAALNVPSKIVFAHMAQTVLCVGCRRSAERLYNQLRDSGHPAIDPLLVTSEGGLSVGLKHSAHARSLCAIFSDHRLPLSLVLDSIPKLKKSGRCLLHSMDGVRCRSGSVSWREMWEEMEPTCRDAITLISSEQLLTTLDNYLRKHRFCQECKNKVHKAFNIMVGQATIEPSKEKGYVASLYSGIRRCVAKKHIHVPSDTDYVLHLITRAEPELQGRRERHAKTLEIAQEEVLTCLGLFLYERLQRVHSRLREEEQTWEVLLHVALDVLHRSVEMAVEEKQGFSKFELLCEELERQELKEKAKREKKKIKKRKAKKNEEGKENINCQCADDEDQCHECQMLSVAPTVVNGCSSAIAMTDVGQVSSGLCVDFCHGGEGVERGGDDSVSMLTISSSGGDERGSSEEKESCHSSPDLCRSIIDESLCHQRTTLLSPIANGVSTDSIYSRFSQGSRDCGYGSARSCCSSRDSSEAACGEGLCSHPLGAEEPEEPLHVGAVSPVPSRAPLLFTMSLQQMLDDSPCEDDEIPEAEIQAWRAHLGSVKQQRAELRQTLRQRFQQLCHRDQGEQLGAVVAPHSYCLRLHDNNTSCPMVFVAKTNSNI